MSGPIAVAVALAAGVAWAVVAIVRDAALRRGVLDVPNARSSHARPTPRLGGLGIAAAVTVAIAVGAATVDGEMRALVLLLTLALLVAAVSLVDDLRGLPALARLAVHLATGTAAVALLGPMRLVDGIGGLDPTLAARLDAVLTVVWIVGFMNAFNFMDGIDGIAGGQGLVAGAAIGALGWLLDAPAATLLGLAIAAACLGFLPHNWAPASIFMGDVGSAFLGFLIAAAPLAAPATAQAPVGLVPVAIAAWPFLFDAVLTFLRRAARGENVMAAHRTHLYQRLTQAGWTHGRVAALYTALAAVAAVLVVAPPASGRVTAPVVAYVAASAAALWSIVVHAERQRQAPAAARSVEDSSRA